MKTINDREQQQKSAIPAGTGDRRMDRSIEGGILLAMTARQNVQSGQSPVGGCLPVKLEFVYSFKGRNTIFSVIILIHSKNNLS